MRVYRGLRDSRTSLFPMGKTITKLPSRFGRSRQDAPEMGSPHPGDERLGDADHRGDPPGPHIAAREPFDLHVHPFVTLQRNSPELGIAPHFLISSNVEENMLRVCSWRDRGTYDVLSQSKEDEQGDDLKMVCDGRYKVIGPRRLPDGLPNLDLALEDRGSSTLVIIELKWLRKPMQFRERISHDEEIQKGRYSLERSRNLRGKPLFLKDAVRRILV